MVPIAEAANFRSGDRKSRVMEPRINHLPQKFSPCLQRSTNSDVSLARFSDCSFRFGDSVSSECNPLSSASGDWPERVE